MKPLILALLITGSLFSQPSATVAIVHVEPDTLKPGDTFTIYFTYVAPTPTNMSSVNGFYLVGPTLQQHKLWEDNYNWFTYMPTKVINSTTCTALAVATPTAWKMGNSRLDTKGAGANQTYTVHFKMPDPVDTTGGPDTVVTSLRDLSIYGIPTYYNLQGDQVQPQPGMILIEQVGLRRRKVLLSE